MVEEEPRMTEPEMRVAFSKLLDETLAGLPDAKAEEGVRLANSAVLLPSHPHPPSHITNHTHPFCFVPLYVLAVGGVVVVVHRLVMWLPLLVLFGVAFGRE